MVFMPLMDVFSSGIDSSSLTMSSSAASTTPSAYGVDYLPFFSYDQYGGSSSYNQYITVFFAEYTPPLKFEMLYQLFMDGGYKSMDCGYGY